ncbi:MAG TPA: hypothetical protein VGH34_21360 [Vicinamibacterales bacterium]|jgi:hypothetical protein
MATHKHTPLIPYLINSPHLTDRPPSGEEQLEYRQDRDDRHEKVIEPSKCGKRIAVKVNDREDGQRRPVTPKAANYQLIGTNELSSLRSSSV